MHVKNRGVFVAVDGVEIAAGFGGVQEIGGIASGHNVFGAKTFSNDQPGMLSCPCVMRS